jgi:ATP-dependent DNA helicase RecG
LPLDLQTPIQFLKGVGPALGDRLRKKGIYNVKDLVEYIPRAYEDQRLNRKIENLEVGETVKLKAQVLKSRQFALRGGKRKMYELLVKDETGSIVCKFFRLPFKGYFNSFEPMTPIYVIGTVVNYGGRKEFHHPDLEIIKSASPAQNLNQKFQNSESLDETNNKAQAGSNKSTLVRSQNNVDFSDHADEDQTPRENTLVPVYSETEGLTQKKIRSLVDAAFKNLALSEMDLKSEKEKLLSYDPLPDWLKTELKLPEFKDSLHNIHYPSLVDKYNYHEFKTPFHYRLIFNEFFEMELLCAYKKQFRQKTESLPMILPSNRLEDLKTQLPFKLTNAQSRAIDDILGDMRQSSPMHRLVQGDVGSGKTLVALCAAVYAIDNGFQVTLMAPTEILAEQHLTTAKKILEPLGIKCGFISGSQKTKAKLDVLEQLANGEIQFCVGTHALIEDPVTFKNLGLVIVDEQHRFGVAQRQKLKDKSAVPHFLLMTATPIPRTLSMSLFGDLDVSVIDELPPGRTPIQTKQLYASQKKDLYPYIKKQIQNGRQAYIVYPLIEESETLDLKNATEEFEKLKQVFAEFNVGLLHGRMKADEKDEVMQDFKNNKIQILVSTTVIEVGVDVPNANIMVIENAERFGLSQLHQLRGRVGRGAYESYCFLVMGEAISQLAKERVQMMVKTNNGFEIAEFDLKIRGPGEFLGSKQSGLPLFKFARLGENTNLLELARKTAFDIFAKDPELKEPENIKIKKLIETQTHKLKLSEIG